MPQNSKKIKFTVMSYNMKSEDFFDLHTYKKLIDVTVFPSIRILYCSIVVV